MNKTRQKKHAAKLLRRDTTVEATDSGFVGRFTAMASPCEVLVDSGDRSLAAKLCELAAVEAWRIEQKFSRYRDDNIVFQINNANGAPICVDDETANLLDYAARAWQLSDGAFDITSGVLRKIWRFDGGDQLPSPANARELAAQVGWEKLDWRRPNLSLPANMEIDLGGIGKEYAVDRAAALIKQHSSVPVLVNFGGDLFATAPPVGNSHWSVGVERVGGAASALIQLQRGGLATSGDANRYLLRDAVRYSHVLDPKTGWPVADAPRAVSVLANTCVEAGLLATLAMLKGARAEEFLAAQEVMHWVQRE